MIISFVNSEYFFYNLGFYPLFYSTLLWIQVFLNISKFKLLLLFFNSFTPISDQWLKIQNMWKVKKCTTYLTKISQINVVQSSIKVKKQNFNFLNKKFPKVLKTLEQEYSKYRKVYENICFSKVCVNFRCEVPKFQIYST